VGLLYKVFAMGVKNLPCDASTRVNYRKTTDSWTSITRPRERQRQHFFAVSKKRNSGTNSVGSQRFNRCSCPFYLEKFPDKFFGLFFLIWGDLNEFSSKIFLVFFCSLSIFSYTGLGKKFLRIFPVDGFF